MSRFVLKCATEIVVHSPKCHNIRHATCTWQGFGLTHTALAGKCRTKSRECQLTPVPSPDSALVVNRNMNCTGMRIGMRTEFYCRYNCTALMAGVHARGATTAIKRRKLQAARVFHLATENTQPVIII